MAWPPSHEPQEALRSTGVTACAGRIKRKSDRAQALKGMVQVAVGGLMHTHYPCVSKKMLGALEDACYFAQAARATLWGR